MPIEKKILKQRSAKKVVFNCIIVYIGIICALMVYLAIKGGS